MGDRVAGGGGRQITVMIPYKSKGDDKTEQIFWPDYSFVELNRFVSFTVSHFLHIQFCHFKNLRSRDLSQIFINYH